MATKLDLAIAQLIGFHHGAHGFTIKSLVDSMGLTKSEWNKIKDLAYLNESEVQDVDEYFEKQKSKK